MMQDKEIKDYVARIQRHRLAIGLGLIVYIIYISLMLIELNRSLRFQWQLMTGFLLGAGVLAIIHFKSRVPSLPETHFLGVSLWLPISYRSCIELLKTIALSSFIAVSMYLLRESEDSRIRVVGFVIFESIITTAIIALFTKYRYRNSDLLKLFFYAALCFATFWFPLNLDALAWAGAAFFLIFFLQDFTRIFLNPVYYGLISDPYIVEKTSGRIFGPAFSQNAVVGKDVRVETGIEDEISVEFDEVWQFPTRYVAKRTYSKVYIASFNYGRGIVDVAFPPQYRQWFEERFVIR